MELGWCAGAGWWPKPLPVPRGEPQLWCSPRILREGNETTACTLRSLCARLGMCWSLRLVAPQSPPSGVGQSLGGARWRSWGCVQARDQQGRWQRGGVGTKEITWLVFVSSSPGRAWLETAASGCKDICHCGRSGGGARLAVNKKSSVGKGRQGQGARGTTWARGQAAWACGGIQNLKTQRAWETKA